VFDSPVGRRGGASGHALVIPDSLPLQGRHETAGPVTSTNEADHDRGDCPSRHGVAMLGKRPIATPARVCGRSATAHLILAFCRERALSSTHGIAGDSRAGRGGASVWRNGGARPRPRTLLAAQRAADVSTRRRIARKRAVCAPPLGHSIMTEKMASLVMILGSRAVAEKFSFALLNKLAGVDRL
jgi:hypothetical protein